MSDPSCSSPGAAAGTSGSAVDAYGSYLQKEDRFPSEARPAVGAKWPREGFFLPDLETFLKAIEAQNSAATLSALLAAVDAPPAAGARK